MIASWRKCPCCWTWPRNANNKTAPGQGAVFVVSRYFAVCFSGQSSEKTFHGLLVVDQMEGIHIDQHQRNIQEQIQAIADAQNIFLDVAVGHEVHGISLGFQYKNL